VWAGGEYLAKMLKQFKELPLALAAYNWGPGNMAKYGYDKAPFETKDYVGNLLAMHNSGRYQVQEPQGKMPPAKRKADPKIPMDPMLAEAQQDEPTLDDDTMMLLAELLQNEELA
jgi:hypothetical protein